MENMFVIYFNKYPLIIVDKYMKAIEEATGITCLNRYEEGDIVNSIHGLSEGSIGLYYYNIKPFVEGEPDPDICITNELFHWHGVVLESVNMINYKEQYPEFTTDEEVIEHIKNKFVEKAIWAKEHIIINE